MTTTTIQDDRAVTSSPPSAFGGIGWRAHWIGADALGDLSTAAFADGGPRAPFHRTIFRRTVELASVPDEAPARLTADSRYVLLVNGAEVGRGPARSQPRRQRFDE